MSRGRGEPMYSFLPGPEKLSPHLAEQAWKKCVDKEEAYTLSCQGNVNRTPRSNPITWEPTPPASRLSTGRLREHDVDILSLRSSRLGTGASCITRSSVRSGRSASRNRCGTSKRLGTAGSYTTNVPSEAGLTSMISLELEEERKQRKAAEIELARLRKQLADVQASQQSASKPSSAP
mmetsp:Transcript_26112/g.45449  ORF Transcript_26112/g.45449 Transcript_26112/m.45449 type:complete len:178 (-) Transcript_26112:45-578(-)